MSAAEPRQVERWLVWDRHVAQPSTSHRSYEEAVAFVADPSHPERALLSISPVYAEETAARPGADRRRREPRRGEERVLHYAREALLACALQLAESDDDGIGLERDGSLGRLREIAAAYRLAESYAAAVASARQGVER